MAEKSFQCYFYASSANSSQLHICICRDSQRAAGLDGRLESSNNRAERSVKPFVIARQYFLFANTANGVEGSSIIFSLIETAKENKLDPCRYLTHVLGLATNLDQSNSDWAEQLLPENAPKYCKANYRKK